MDKGNFNAGEIRDAMLVIAPEAADLILDRDAVVKKYCADKGWNADQLTIEQILEMRRLPAWIDAGR